MKKIVKTIPIPEKIKTKLSQINFIKLSVGEDINEYIAGLMITDEFTKRVFGKVFDIYDWERLFYALKFLLEEDSMYNNGVLTENLASYLLSITFNLKSLLVFENINFQDPDKGIDLIFLNDNKNLDFYEVKSSIENNDTTYSTNGFVISKTKEAINSLFGKNSRNVSKLVDIREQTGNIKTLEPIYRIAREMLLSSGREMINFVGRKEVNFNICLIGKEIKLNEQKFVKSITDVFNKVTIYDKDKYKSIYDMKILDKIRIYNLISFQLIGELNLKTIMRLINQKIITKGLINNE